MEDKSESGDIGWGDVIAQGYLPPLLLICLGVSLHATDSLIVATMMPAIVTEIGGASLVSWAVSLYGLGTIVTGTASGLLALRFGVKRPMVVTAVLFSFGCLVASLAPEMWVLLVGRLLQGLGPVAFDDRPGRLEHGDDQQAAQQADPHHGADHVPGVRRRRGRDRVAAAHVGPPAARPVP